MSRILQIRGTHGSGKSTLVRSVMDEHFSMTPIYVEGRKRPLKYHGSHRFWVGPPSLVVPGSYENATGGCDTISEIAVIFDVVKEAARTGCNVLFEGILAQHSAGRVVELRDLGHELVVVVLDTSLEECIASVRQRRAERGDERPFSTDNVEKEWKGVQSAARTLKGRGVDVRHLNRADARVFAVEFLTKN